MHEAMWTVCVEHFLQKNYHSGATENVGLENARWSMQKFKKKNAKNKFNSMLLLNYNSQRVKLTDKKGCSLSTRQLGLMLLTRVDNCLQLKS